jgi:predicted GIY-YIG superfamily endonuclease
MNRKYRGNYRELENILVSAVTSTKDGKRNEILPEDLKILEKMKLFSNDQEGPKGENYANQYGNIPLINIIEHSDKMRASIVEAKVKEVMRTSRDMKSVLLAQSVRGKGLIRMSISPGHPEDSFEALF